MEGRGEERRSGKTSVGCRESRNGKRKTCSEVRVRGRERVGLGHECVFDTKVTLCVCVCEYVVNLCLCVFSLPGQVCSYLIPTAVSESCGAGLIVSVCLCVPVFCMCVSRVTSCHWIPE